MYYYPYFIDEETEAERDKVTHLWPQRANCKGKAQLMFLSSEGHALSSNPTGLG